MGCDHRSPFDPPQITPVARVVPVATVDAWLNHCWEQAVLVERLDALEALRVTTANSTYDIAVVQGAAGEILIRGGKYFPGWTAVKLLGCSLGGGMLKRHAVHVGFRLELAWDGRVIITSSVAAVTRAPDTRSDASHSNDRPAAQPALSQ